MPTNIRKGNKNLLKRGFKAHSERLATMYREKLGIHPCAPLCAFKLAEHLNIPVFTAEYFLANDSKIFNSKDGKSPEWSALTMQTKSKLIIIIYNSFNSHKRQQSDIMHELAHIICEHKHNINKYSDLEIPIGMRDFNDTFEEEAKCLGSTLQLSKPCLLWAKKREMSKEEISEHFSASTDMVTYRMNILGLNKAFKIH